MSLYVLVSEPGCDLSVADYGGSGAARNIYCITDVVGVAM
jgi:hypothetical protein